MCVFQHKRDVCLGFGEARAGGCKGRNLLTCFEFGFLARAFLKIDRALASLPICSFSSILRPRLGFFFFVRKRWRADDAIPLADTHLVPVLRARLSLPPSIASPSSSFLFSHSCSPSARSCSVAPGTRHRSDSFHQVYSISWQLTFF